ncbi:MAG: rhodanese-like domain-containing protein [Thermoflexales bacterium]|nr:rhodanese-like domain-containing protein [Thermoflexales bacterium]
MSIKRTLFVPLVAAMFMFGACAPAATPAPAAPSAGPVSLKPLASDISPEQARSMAASGAFILDVREPSEWEEFHVANTTLIPLGQLEKRLSEVPRDREVVVICRSGNRSTSGRDILAKAGFTSVTSMSGGLLSWRAKGFPTLSGK